MAEKRVTVENLRLYVPLFQEGEKAEELLAEPIGRKTAKALAERAVLLSQSGLKKLAQDELSELAYPLMRREILNLIRNSHLKREEDEIFNVIYYAGLDGMQRGLRKFNVNKIESSATNYLFQWILVYAKKELLKLEAPMGVPPTRFQKHKKIAAVRKSLSEALGRPATNQELLEYFHTGRAEVKSMHGPRVKAQGVSLANQRITLELIEEQEQIEKNLNFSPILDNEEDYKTERLLASYDDRPFEETLLGSFMSEQDFSAKARAVMRAELQTELTAIEEQLLQKVERVEYNRLVKLWKLYLADPRGEFKGFLERSVAQGATGEAVSILSSLNSQDVKSQRTSRKHRYSELFEKKED